MDRKHIHEIVEELTLLAEELSKGQIRVGAHSANISEPVAFKTKKKVKGDSITIEISVHALLADTDFGKDIASAAVEKKKFTKKEHKEIPRKKTPAPRKTVRSRKKIKKDLSKVWKTVSAKIVKQEALSKDDGNALRQIITSNPYAGKPWEQEWLTCCDTMKKCLDTLARGDFHSAATLVAESNRLMKNCHKLYK